MREDDILRPVASNPQIVTLMSAQAVPANTGTSIPPYTDVSKFRFINLFVEFTQTTAGEPPVDMGVTFALDANGGMAARSYVNLEMNVPSPQPCNFIEVSGAKSWHGQPHNVSRYLARLPIMGPFIEVFVYNRAAVERRVTVQAYLVP